MMMTPAGDDADPGRRREPARLGAPASGARTDRRLERPPHAARAAPALERVALGLRLHDEPGEAVAPPCGEDRVVPHHGVRGVVVVEPLHLVHDLPSRRGVRRRALLREHRVVLGVAVVGVVVAVRLAVRRTLVAREPRQRRVGVRIGDPAPAEQVVRPLVDDVAEPAEVTTSTFAWIPISRATASRTAMRRPRSARSSGRSTGTRAAGRDRAFLGISRTPSPSEST